LNKFGFPNSDVAISNAKYLEHLFADKFLSQNLETHFCSCPPRGLVYQVEQEKIMIGHISFDDINPSLFLNFSNGGRARRFVKISAA
jgi:hypothetical protein